MEASDALASLAIGNEAMRRSHGLAFYFIRDVYEAINFLAGLAA
jgi:hypothetical protein